jgi:hypothetical protein
MAGNVQGLLLCWHLCSSSQELKPNRITDVEVKHKNSIELRLTELLLNSEQKDEVLFVSQHSSKPHVLVAQLTFCS